MSRRRINIRKLFLLQLKCCNIEILFEGVRFPDERHPGVRRARGHVGAKPPPGGSDPAMPALIALNSLCPQIACSLALFLPADRFFLRNRVASTYKLKREKTICP